VREVSLHVRVDLLAATLEDGLLEQAIPQVAGDVRDHRQLSVRGLDQGIEQRRERCVDARGKLRRVAKPTLEHGTTAPTWWLVRWFEV